MASELVHRHSTGTSVRLPWTPPFRTLHRKVCILARIYSAELLHALVPIPEGHSHANKTCHAVQHQSLSRIYSAWFMITPQALIFSGTPCINSIAVD